MRTARIFCSKALSVSPKCKLRWAHDKYADYYQVQMLDEKGEFAVVSTTTRANHTLTGLESGTKYTLRVVAVNTAGTSPASEPIIAKAA